MRTIELLAPAKNLECGIAAVDHGADAVYIGAAQFSARSAAANTMEDIALLVKYAHRFRVKVFVAVNTVLTDDQLPAVEALIQQAYEAGVDAIIIQDMGILQLNLPPIAIHASTQTDNRSLEKVQFLASAGFSRVVLARELTLAQIKHIAENSSVELEVFVHGALCVSYSGQCYISQAMSGRSANRGECAQYCRLSYDLYDGDGNHLERAKHLLSLKDLDLSESLPELIEAGVTSLKIEGRLKDVEYVKNITAYYRRKIDTFLKQSEGNYRRASSGSTRFFFEPDPEKSFRRSSTDYFLHGRHSGIHQPETPKSLGEPIGLVTYVGKNYLETDTVKELHNADGLCYMSIDGILKGFSINSIENSRRVFPNLMPELKVGTQLYRNLDHVFVKSLKSKTAERKIALKMEFTETHDGFQLLLTDEEGNRSLSSFKADKQEARQTDGVIASISQQLGKLGATIFEAESIRVELQKPWFLAASVLNDWRRTAIDKLEQLREENYVRERPAERKAADYPLQKLTYLGNVTNALAKHFYETHGVTEVEPGFEVKAGNNVPLMFTKHCIKYEMGWCPREGKTMPVKEPLKLRHGLQHFRLAFDCVKCEMHVIHTTVKFQ